MKALFVAGTDTGVGKTVVTSFLAKFLLQEGYNVVTQKWIQTGCHFFDPDSDITMHLKSMGRQRNDFKAYLPHIAPYIFRNPYSPHLASRMENKAINPNRIKKSFSLLSREFDRVIIEGVGGVLVPFTRKCLIIDIVKDLGLPVLLVAQNKIGAINHTLLTIEALRQRKITILGIVFNNLKNEDRNILKDNPAIIKTLSGENIFGVLPWVKSQSKLYEAFVPIAKKILRKHKNE